MVLDPGRLEGLNINIHDYMRVNTCSHEGEYRSSPDTAVCEGHLFSPTDKLCTIRRYILPVMVGVKIIVGSNRTTKRFVIIRKIKQNNSNVLFSCFKKFVI